MMVQVVSKLSYPINCEKKEKGNRIVPNIKLHSTPERIKDAKNFNCRISNLIDSIIQIDNLIDSINLIDNIPKSDAFRLGMVQLTEEVMVTLQEGNIATRQSTSIGKTCLAEEMDELQLVFLST
jgi:hypothetical protein